MARHTPALMRALDILELFVDKGSRWNAAEIGDLTGLPRTSVHELLTTLTFRGYLERSTSGHYGLGVRTMQLGNAYASRFDLLGSATELARDLAGSTGETCSVAVREGSEVFYLAKVEGRESLALISSIGKRAPASCTGLGKALLAALDDDALDRLYDGAKLPALTARSITDLAALKEDLRLTRERGYAIEYEESGPNAACTAAPIRDVAGKVVAAVSISVPVARWSQFAESHWAGLVLDAAARLSTRLGHQGGAATPRLAP